jgi:ATP-dependent DNA ligase
MRRSKLVGSPLGLYNQNNKLDHVGFTSGFADFDRAALTSRLGPSEVRRFSGDAPGGTSRWRAAKRRMDACQT